MYIIPVGQNPTGAVNILFPETLTAPELSYFQDYACSKEERDI
jgi:hypothetical protein